ncbi:hypothetical protein T11_12665 [Trichinella zimbabwensis]|uniref:Uncharacterized protein n=1 Tax=Trichinella zimbabwensis TaxID=268475 RepID=A0A0V1GU17_9BILA|nr:hypothetical protein T11_12665 [Trichinella zimbabwensis]
MGKRPPIDCAPLLPKRAPLKKHLLSPISQKEVSEHLKLMNLVSASGPDGVKVSHLRDIGPQCVSKVFNAFLLERHPPGPKGLSDHTHFERRQSPARF